MSWCPRRFRRRLVLSLVLSPSSAILVMMAAALRMPAVTSAFMGVTTKPRPLLNRHVMAITTTTTTASGTTNTTVDGVDQSKATSDLLFETTPLGRDGAHLLRGLDVYQVPSKTDEHPLSVYGIGGGQTESAANPNRPPILLLHGRTWSSVPVYHLLGGQQQQQSRDSTTSSRSFMEALLWKGGLQPYCMDFRGFGGTHADATGYVEPNQCVSDAESVIEWMAQRHPDAPITLLGWSQGALVAHLAAQKTKRAFDKLVLYGSIYDPLVRYPREPLYRLTSQPNQTFVPNTFDMALEDFTLEGTISPEPAKLFAEAALTTDPIKAVWKHLYQFNNCDPARISHLPTLVVAGDQDPYAPLHVQQELFCNLGRGSDRTWSILADCDHAVHLLENGRQRLIQLVSSFVHEEGNNA